MNNAVVQQWWLVEATTAAPGLGILFGLMVQISVQVQNKLFVRGKRLFQFISH